MKSEFRWVIYFRHQLQGGFLWERLKVNLFDGEFFEASQWAKEKLRSFGHGDGIAVKVRVGLVRDIEHADRFDSFGSDDKIEVCSD